MASPGFPTRKAQGSGGMTSAMPEILDGPPPSPTMPQGGPVPGQATPFPSFAQMAPPITAGSPGQQLSPEILMGIIQGLGAVEGIWDSAASLLPDLAADFAMLKDFQQRIAAKIVVKGGTPAATSTGNSFPGGGFDRGVM